MDGGGRRLPNTSAEGVAYVSIHQIRSDTDKWWDVGACRGLDSGIFYPDDDVEAQAAKSVCETCVVKQT